MEMQRLSCGLQGFCMAIKDHLQTLTRTQQHSLTILLHYWSELDQTNNWNCIPLFSESTPAQSPAHSLINIYEGLRVALCLHSPLLYLVVSSFRLLSMFNNITERIDDKRLMYYCLFFGEIGFPETENPSSSHDLNFSKFTGLTLAFFLPESVKQLRYVVKFYF